MNAIPLLCALALLPLTAAEPAASPPAAAQPTAALLSSAPNAKGARLCFIHAPGHYTDCPYRLCLARADGSPLTLIPLPASAKTEATPSEP